ncbi:MAG: trypsin-like peptidase domain-containing protein [Spirochaetes bacterium]|nr:trypsin-like peptidase domain-containing protein [Spirochaetota bacterium]
MLPADVSEFNTYFINAAQKAKPSVVNINVYDVQQKGKGALQTKVGYGSGTIISKNGFIVTNYHVLNKGNFYRVILNDGTECDLQPFQNGKYYIKDEKTDLAVIKIDENEISRIDIIPIENSENLKEGEWVIAIGNPYGLRQSITSGIVSSKGRNDIGFADIEDFIQTDVPINPGNSGGPLVNLYGKLVGINTAIRTVSGGYQGISFAIPSNIVIQVCSELVKFGRVRRGWLGFLAKESKISGTANIVEVLSVIENSPAENSGLKEGDVIKEIDGQKISSLGELLKIVGNKPVESTIVLNISRDGELFEYSLPLIEKEKHLKINEALKTIFSLYGIELDKNSKTSDAVISYLSPIGIAYHSGLKSGDIVVELNDKKLASVEEFIRIFLKSQSRIKGLKILRDDKLFFIKITED